MTGLMVLLLAAAVFALIAFVFKAPRGSWEAVGAALMIGAAGFVWQASWGQPGAPKAPAQAARTGGAELVEARKKLAGEPAGAGNRFSIIADGLARNGNFGDAADVLQGAVQQDPRNADAWLAMANYLVAHSQGVLTPAARYAYGQAAKADPQHPGPLFFEGLALATSGQLEDARATWAKLLAGAPADAPWRDDLAARLARLDEFIAARDAGQLTK